jgi:hypothetical protein
MDNIKLYLDSLAKWLDQKQLIQEVIQSFWDFFTKCKEKEPDEYRSYFGDNDDSSITLVEHSIAFEIEPQEDSITGYDFYAVRLEDYDCCTIRFDVECGGKCIGYYKYYFTTDGVCCDDTFVRMILNK